MKMGMLVYVLDLTAMSVRFYVILVWVIFVTKNHNLIIKKYLSQTDRNKFKNFKVFKYLQNVVKIDVFTTISLSYGLYILGYV